MTTTSTDTPVAPLLPVPESMNLLKPEATEGSSCCGGSACGSN